MNPEAKVERIAFNLEQRDAYEAAALTRRLWQRCRELEADLQDAREVFAQFRYLNRLNIPEPDKHAEAVMDMLLDGVIVGPGNRESIRKVLEDHFRDYAMQRDTALSELAEARKEIERLRAMFTGDDVVEMVARAICKSAGRDPDGAFVDRYGRPTGIKEWRRWEGEARAVIALFTRSKP